MSMIWSSRERNRSCSPPSRRSRGRISQIPRSISSSEKNHGLRFEGILKIQFARKSPSKGQKPANSITSAHPISQPAQGIQNSSRTTNYKSAEKYVGADTLHLLVLFPGGFGQEVHLNINVR
jgi:hypothetical protein